MHETENNFEEVTSLDSKLEMMDIATKLRKNSEEAQQNLDIHLIKNDIKETILKSAELRGEELTDEQVETAIDTKLSEMYAFQAPKKGLNTSLAYAYADRKRIGKKYGIPTIAIGTAGAVIFGLVQLFSYMNIKSQEHSVEDAVLENFSKRKSIEMSINEFKTAKTQYVNGNELGLIVEDVQFKLTDSKEFFDKYCPKGDPTDVITTENYESVENKLNTIIKTINEAENKTKNGKSLIKLDKNLIIVKSSLDINIKDIRGTEAPDKLMSRAENEYKSGVISVQGLDLSKATTSKNNLEGLKNDIKVFAVLPSQLEQVYSSIITVSKDSRANNKANELYNESKIMINDVNIPQLRHNINEMKDLDVLLNQEYAVKIVSRQGIKSGIDRYYTDERGRRSSGYYLIVEAINDNGNILTKKITNEENNRVKEVKMWGERVPEYIYERVKSDKLDNGIINDNLYSAKKKGYLDDIIIMKDNHGRPLKRLGQITEW